MIADRDTSSDPVLELLGRLPPDDRRTVEYALDAEAGAERTTALVLALIETLRSGVLVEDGDGQVAFVNQVLCNEFKLGTEWEALIGAETRLVLEIIKNSVADPDVFAERLDTIVDGGREVWGEEIELSDGRVLELDRAPLRIADEPAGFVWHVRDITERKLVERELARQNDELRAIDRMKDDFVALVTHELRTPLTSIAGYAECLLEDDRSLAEGQRRALGVVLRNAHRLQRLVGDLLFVARLQAGGQPELERVEVDLRRVVCESVEAQQLRAARAGITLVSELDPVPSVHGDAGRLGQLLDNLLSNAVKYSPDGGEIRVRLRQRGHRAVLEVADRGIGIPAVEQAHVFTRFFRASTATERSIHGTGLGLMVARTIAEAHGGLVSFESEEGAGTTFRLELPLAVADRLAA